MLEEIPNERWHMMQIKKAKNLDDLRGCMFEIDYDKWEQLEWTLDKAKMNRVRNYFAFRCMALGIKTSDIMKTENE